MRKLTMKVSQRTSMTQIGHNLFRSKSQREHMKRCERKNQESDKFGKLDAIVANWQ